MPQRNANIVPASLGDEDEYDIKDMILLDSSCDTNTFNIKKWLVKLALMDGLQPGTSAYCQSQGNPKGMGTIEIHQGGRTVQLKNSVYDPSAMCNMIAPGPLDAKGILMSPERKALYDKDSGQEMLRYSYQMGVAVVYYDTAGHGTTEIVNFTTLPGNEEKGPSVALHHDA